MARYCRPCFVKGKVRNATEIVDGAPWCDECFAKLGAEPSMRPVDRKGQRCRIVASGKMNSVCVEFEDGFCVITSRYAVRRIKG